MSNHVQSRVSVTGCEGRHPLPSTVTWADQDAATQKWRRALRHYRQQQAFLILVGAYGLALWLLASLCVACFIVPAAPEAGLSGLLAMCFVALALIQTWRHHWRKLVTTEHDAWRNKGRL
jgi:hypothetical protein